MILSLVQIRCLEKEGNEELRSQIIFEAEEFKNYFVDQRT
jgi:hypothetical protein